MRRCCGSGCRAWPTFFWSLQGKEAHMLDPPIPDDETLRVSDLHAMQILDTPPEERFDRITRTAQMLFRVPIALISLVDSDRQWFKSKQGLDALETPRSVSFCAHA